MAIAEGHGIKPDASGERHDRLHAVARSLLGPWVFMVCLTDRSVPPPSRELDGAEHQHRNRRSELEHAEKSIRTDAPLDGDRQATDEEHDSGVSDGHRRAEDEGLARSRAATDEVRGGKSLPVPRGQSVCGPETERHDDGEGGERPASARFLDRARHASESLDDDDDDDGRPAGHRT